MTPLITDGALAGITHQLIMQLASGMGIETRERSLTSYDLFIAEACF